MMAIKKILSAGAVMTLISSASFAASDDMAISAKVDAITTISIAEKSENDISAALTIDPNDGTIGATAIEVATAAIFNNDVDGYNVAASTLDGNFNLMGNYTGTPPAGFTKTINVASITFGGGMNVTLNDTTAKIPTIKQISDTVPVSLNLGTNDLSLVAGTYTKTYTITVTGI